MYYRNRIAHYIGAGESLYNIANLYNTTPEEILKSNPHINPYNLQMGQILSIFPKYEDFDYINEDSRSSNNITKQQFKLSNKMRMFWEQHVMWTRMIIISIINNLNDLEQVEARLLRNPKDIASIFGMYYGKNVEKKISELLTEHLSIGGKLITAYKLGDTVKIDELNKSWYKNAEDIANYLHSINSYYDKEEVQSMLFEHLDMTKKQVAMRIARNYTSDIETFDEIETQALKMADYFTNGIVEQFSDSFIR